MIPHGVPPLSDADARARYDKHVSAMYYGVLNLCNNERPADGDPRQALWDNAVDVFHAHRWMCHRQRPDQNINDEVVLAAIHEYPWIQTAEVEQVARINGAVYTEDETIKAILKRLATGGHIVSDRRGLKTQWAPPGIPFPNTLTPRRKPLI